MRRGEDQQALVDAAREGDDGAFERLVRSTYADVYTLAVRLTGNRDDASDVVQEAYLRAYRGIERFRGDSQFSTWIHRITANCASTLRQRRSRHRHGELIEEAVPADDHPEHDPERRIDAGALRERLQQAVGKLPPKLRSVVVLRDVYGMSHRAIAEELGITESAAKVRLHRARRRLQELLDRDEAEVDEGALRAG